MERPSYVLGTYERHVIKSISERLPPGGVFYDVGAHIGFFSIFASDLVGPSGSVVAIEASGLVRPFLIENVSQLPHNNVNVLPIAVGDRPGAVKFASFESYSTVGHVAGEDTPVDALIETVTQKTLDGLVSSGQRPPTLIKIDVEGGELGVLAGSSEIIATHRPDIIVEVRAGTKSPVELLMSHAGYEVTRLSEASGNEAAGFMDLLCIPSK